MPSPERIIPVVELAALPIFGRMKEGELADIARTFTVVRLRKGETVLAQGERPEGLAVLVRGWVKATAVGEGPRTTILAVFRAPLFPGLAPVFADRPSVVSYVAMDDVVLLRASREDFERLLDAFPELARGFNRYLAEATLDQTRRFHGTRLGRVEERLARLLLSLAERYGAAEADGIALHIPITRQEVADIIDATVSTVIRQMRAWEKAGLISATRKRIALKKPEALRAIAGRKA